jgi:hypothetical protein
VITCIAECIIRAIYKKKKGYPGNHIKRERVLILIGVGIVMVNWFFKNYMLVVKGVDLLPPM